MSRQRPRETKAKVVETWNFSRVSLITVMVIGTRILDFQCHRAEILQILNFTLQVFYGKPFSSWERWIIWLYAISLIFRIEVRNF